MRQNFNRKDALMREAQQRTKEFTKPFWRHPRKSISCEQIPPKLHIWGIWLPLHCVLKLFDLCICHQRLLTERDYLLGCWSFGVAVDQGVCRWRPVQKAPGGGLC